MLKLHGRASMNWNGDPLVLRIATDAVRSNDQRRDEALLIGVEEPQAAVGFQAYLSFRPIPSLDASRVVILPDAFRYLSAGDIVRIIPRTGELVTLFRCNSQSNSFLITERCNSNCLMCSQPPKDADDSFLIRVFDEAIQLVDPTTRVLGITGGEPTLLGDAFPQLIARCKQHLPSTSLHVLSNGRMFRYLTLCQEIGEIGHPDLMIGIPLYSDIAGSHDYVVQAKGAFDETIRGIMNLKRCGVPVELRVVLHQLTVKRLPALARFICRNLPNVDQVALMGLEMMGYVKMNQDVLCVDPADYQPALREAVGLLAAARMNVLIYNHQLCVLDRELWSFAAKSISDWKNEYIECCDDCCARDQCGGFFSSTLAARGRNVHPIRSDECTSRLDLSRKEHHACGSR